MCRVSVSRGIPAQTPSPRGRRARPPGALLARDGCSSSAPNKAGDATGFATVSRDPASPPTPPAPWGLGGFAPRGSDGVGDSCPPRSAGGGSSLRMRVRPRSGAAVAQDVRPPPTVPHAGGSPGVGDLLPVAARGVGLRVRNAVSHRALLNRCRISCPFSVQISDYQADGHLLAHRFLEFLKRSGYALSTILD